MWPKFNKLGLEMKDFHGRKSTYLTKDKKALNGFIKKVLANYAFNSFFWV